MKLMFIYGPPAAGKLTVAKALCAHTGFKLFHNHLALQWCGRCSSLARSLARVW